MNEKKLNQKITPPPAPCRWLAGLRTTKRQNAPIVTSLCFVASLLFFPTSPAALGAQDKPATEKPVEVRPVEEDFVFPKYIDMVVPAAEELLRARPFDWIILKNQELKNRETLVVEPITIRPDPLARVTIKYEMAQKTLARLLRNKGYKEAEISSLRLYHKNDDGGAAIDAKEAAIKTEIDSLRERIETLKPATYKHQIVLRDISVDGEFMLELRYVDFILHYEDLLLKRADQLIEAGNLPLAYDLLMLVAKRHRDNNDLIRGELESEETSLLAAIKALEDEREALRLESRDLSGAIKPLEIERAKADEAYKAAAKALAAKKSLENERSEMRLKEALSTATNKLARPRMRANVVEKTISGIAVELKDLDEDLRGIRFKLRFARPKDFPNPEPLRKDDLLFPSWPKFDEVYQRFIFKDSDQRLEKGDLTGALRVLLELWKPGTDVPDISARTAEVVNRLIGPKVEQQDYRQARYYLNELLSRDPSNSVGLSWKERLVDLAAKTAAEAQALSEKGEASEAVRTIDRAARIWPDLSGLKDAHRELSDRYQVLRVGVLKLPGGPSATGLPTEADERIRWLSECRMFEPTGLSDRGVKYSSSFLDAWEPTDLGRQVRFQLKFRRADWESRPLITSADVHREVASRIDPASPAFDERFAGFVAGISVESPSDFTVQFRQLPLRLEAAWNLTVSASDASRLLNDDCRQTDNVDFGRHRFNTAPAQDGQMRLTRIRSQAGSRQRRIEEVVETAYSSWDKALQALLRGEVLMLPSVDYSDLKGLQDDGRFQVVPYVFPRSHFLMFNPQSAALKDGQLRRALLHSVPREDLLKQIVNGDSANNARLVTCPFPSNGYGYNRSLTQPSCDPPLAAALALTARKRLGGEIPRLKFVCPDDVHIREVATAMIEYWRRIGVDVQLVTDASAASEWDLCYRSARSIEPLFDAWPLLTMEPEARISGLQRIPESMRRLLLELERSVDWTTAQKHLHRLVEELLIDARYIPLWELDEFLVVRRNVSGIPSKVMHAYHDIERWSVQSWYPQD